ncbi:MAG TPA: tetratricopeptide repeat protein, partial [Candidatus Paceibacterota bacterium]|nr:tetratricopeptide repeat protein [Candidatus Paceibacterota bacterium]
GTERSGDTMYDKIIRWALVVAAALVPVFFLPWTTSVLELNKLMLGMGVAAVALIAWLLSVVSRGRIAWRSTPFDKGILGLLGAVLIAAAFSISPFTSFLGVPLNLSFSFISVFSLAVIYFAVTYTVEDRGRLLLDVFGISVAIALAYGLFQVFGVYLFRFPFAISHAFNSVGSPNALGVLAAVSIPFLGRSMARGWIKIAHLIGMAAGVFLLILLNWSILWVIAAAGMVALIAFESISQEKFRIIRFILPMTLIVLAVFLTVTHFTVTAVKNQLPIEVAPSFILSGDILKGALHEKPFTGYGPENFSLAFDRYGASRLATSTLSSAKFFSATGEAISALAEGGLVMVIAFALFLWGLVQGIRSYVLMRSSHRVPAYTGALWASAVATLVAFVIYPMNFTLLFAFFFLFALAAVALWGDRLREFNIEDSVTLSLSASLGFIGGLILILVGVYMGVSVYVADAAYAKATRLNANDADKAAPLVASAVSWNSHSDTYYRAASQIAIRLLANELNAPADKNDAQKSTRVQNYITSSVNLAKTATTINPREAQNWSNLAGVYESLLGIVDGVDQAAQDAYVKAAEARPGDPSYYNEIGNVYLAKAALLRRANASANASQINSALAVAETNYKKAIDISGNFGLAIYNLSSVYEQEGKLNDAIKGLEKLAPFNSDQPGLLFELGLLYYQSGNRDKAFSTLQQVLVLQPDYANAHWYLSLIYQDRGDTTNAIAELQKILNVEENKDNQTVLDRLTQLQQGTATSKGPDEKPL